MAWLSLISKAIPWQAWAALGAVLAVSGAYTLGSINGASQAKSEAEFAAIQSTLNQLKERGAINESVEATDLRSLCIELGGMPDDCPE